METARDELDDAVAFYERESSGLGKTFIAEVLSALERIAHYPQAWQVCSSRTRRCQTRRFPYGIIYQLRENEILIIAVANLHRKPDYWKDRL